MNYRALCKSTVCGYKLCRQKTHKKTFDIWFMTFSRFLDVVNTHVRGTRAQFHETKCNGLWVIALTKKARLKTILTDVALLPLAVKMSVNVIAEIKWPCALSLLHTVWQDEQDMFGFEHASERFSTTSSYGPGAMDDELRYMQHGDELSRKHRDSSAEPIIASSAAQQMMVVSRCFVIDVQGGPKIVYVLQGSVAT